MARADVTIFNVSADEPGGDDVIVTLTGAKANATASAVSAFQEANNVTIDLTGAGAVAQSGSVQAQDNFPIDYPQVIYNMASSDFDRNMTEEPWRTWNGERDLVKHQGRYPTSSTLNEHYAAYASLKAEFPHMQICSYTHMFGNFPDGTSKLQHLGYQLITDRGMEDDWFAYDTSGNLLYGDGDQQDMIMSALAFHIQPTNSGQNLAEAWAERYFARLDGSFFGGPNLLEYLDGFYCDSTDPKDSKPGYRTQPDLGGVESRPDYDRDGNADSDGDNTQHPSDPFQDGGAIMYQKGILELIRAIRQEYTGNKEHFLVLSNGGRDDNQFDQGSPANTLSGHVWSGAWSGRQSESADDEIGLIKNGSGYEIEDSNPDSKLDSFLRKVSITNAFLELDKQRAYVDCEFSCNTNGTSLEADMTQDDFEFVRMAWGLCFLTEFTAFAPHFTKQASCPPPDEFRYSIGDPLSPRSIGDITNAGVFTRRSDDGNGFLVVECENGMMLFNANEPNGNSPWPQAATDTYPLGSAGSGFHWEMLDGSNYTNPKVPSRQTSNQSPSINDGSTVTEITCPRWCARLVCRVAD